MKRYPVFLLLGPVLSWLYCIVCLAIVNYPGPVFEDDGYWLFSFLVCFTFALLPLAATAAIDRKLSTLRWRSLVCFFVGFAMASGFLLALSLESGSQDHMQKFAEVWWYVGPAWGLPAAVCSWLLGLDEPDGETAGATSH